MNLHLKNSSNWTCVGKAMICMILKLFNKIYLVIIILYSRHIKVHTILLRYPAFMKHS